jgi:hypothetical protein
MKINQVAEGLDRDDHAGNGFFSIEGRLEELLQRLVGALAELSQKLSIEFKIGPEQLGNRKNVLPMGKQVKNMFRDPFAKQQHCFLMAGRAEVTPFAGESQKDFVLALLTLDPGKAFF